MQAKRKQPTHIVSLKTLGCFASAHFYCFMNCSFAALDAKAASLVAKQLVKLQEVSGVCFVLITHRKEYVKHFNVAKQVELTPREKSTRAERSGAWSSSKLHVRIAVEFFESIICAIPLVVIAGVFVGAGTAVVIGKIVQAIQMPALLAVVPRSIQENPLYDIVKDALSDVAGSKLPRVKQKVTATAMR